jgi:hypothetical protein
MIVYFLYHYSSNWEGLERRSIYSYVFLPVGFIWVNFKKTDWPRDLPMSDSAMRKLDSKSSSVEMQESKRDTLTPARMRFFASSVLGPLAGVMSTRELSSLSQ